MSRFLTIILAIPLWSGCQESSFSGNKNPTSSPPGPSQGSSSTPSRPAGRNPGDSADCTDETQINSRILSQKFLNSTPGSKIEYKLTLTGCDGNVRPITPGSLLFDVNAVRTAEKIREGIKYTLILGSFIKKGTLAPVNGKDLFGKTGSQLYYYQNEEDIPVDGNVSEGVFQVDFDGEKLMDLSDGKSTKFRFQTYLKFGPAAPVEHMVEAE